MILNHSFDTILALATPQGSGAIAVVRLSGEDSIALVDSIFYSKKKLINLESQKVVFGTIKKNQELIDEVLVCVFRNPKSYTGEDTVEISCHGSSYIIKSIIELILSKGARLASAGEFTQRAFLNGKMDLTQAEAVADLIASESRTSHHIAMNQMRGGIANELAMLRDELVNFTALIELELDFGEEDVEFADRLKLIQLISQLNTRITQLISTFDYGNAIKNGVPVAIIGKPNAGKSSLLNKLLNEDRAIVSSIAGTTRDTIEETLNIDGITFRFIDTAGLRVTEDEIEKIGISKAYEKMEQARIVIYLFDKNDTTIDEIRYDLSTIPEDKIVMICPSKIDLYPNYDWEEWIQNLKSDTKNYTVLGISAKAEDLNFTRLKNQLVDNVKGNIGENDVIISNSRHLDSLQKALHSILEVETALNNKVTGDLLSPFLRDALRHIGDITGEIDIDKDILGTIFGKFCIGK